MHTILEGEPQNVIDAEIQKLGDLAYKLAEDYDAREAAKRAKELQIMEQLRVEREKRNEAEKNGQTISQFHNPNARYPYMSGMLDSSLVKRVCLNCPQAWFKGPLEKNCDMTEEDFKKTAKQGYLEFGFINTTRFADKEKEHKKAISTILHHEDDVQCAELVKLNEHARELQRNYNAQEELKRQQESAKRWQEYLEREKNKQDAGAKKDS